MRISLTTPEKVQSVSVYVPLDRASTEPLLGARLVNDELFNSTCRQMLSEASQYY